MAAQKLSFNKWTDTQTLIPSRQWHLFSDKNKWDMKPQKDLEELKCYIAEWKEPICKGYILYEFNYTTICKRQNCRDCKRSAVAEGLDKEEMNT